MEDLNDGDCMGIKTIYQIVLVCEKIPVFGINIIHFSNIRPALFVVSKDFRVVSYLCQYFFGGTITVFL